MAKTNAETHNPIVGAARTKRSEPDVPFDRLDGAYTPHQTGMKTSFRADGAQEFSRLVNDRWNDEDKLTNKSGDPRIGTHGRTYEPGERHSRRK